MGAMVQNMWYDNTGHPRPCLRPPSLSRDKSGGFLENAAGAAAECAGVAQAPRCAGPRVARAQHHRAGHVPQRARFRPLQGRRACVIKAINAHRYPWISIGSTLLAARACSAAASGAFSMLASRARGARCPGWISIGPCSCRGHQHGFRGNASVGL